jgi:hypothetical protein
MIVDEKQMMIVDEEQTGKSNTRWTIPNRKQQH